MAGFFSTLFGGGAERDAADRNRATYGQYQDNSFGALDRGYGTATGAVNTGYGSANDRLGANSGLYGDMLNSGNATLDRNLNSGLAALNGAGTAYGDLAKKYGAGTNLYLNSLGVNGAAGNTAAQNAFQAGPGYEFTRDQGLEALNRRRAAAGMLNSGNADADAIRFGTGLADQTYGSWQDRLAGLINPELQATAGGAGVAGNIASVYGNDSAQRLGLLNNVTAGRAGVNTAQAANDVALGNSLANLATNDATNRTGVYGNVTQGNVAASNQQAAGEASGARNLLNAGMGLASLAAGGMGGGSFGSLFGGSGGAGLLGGGGTLYGNGTNFATNPWSSGGMFGGR